jgi:hypothetical protein
VYCTKQGADLYNLRSEIRPDLQVSL